MRKFFSFFVILFMLGMYSCSDEQQVADENEGIINFSFKAEAPIGLKAYTKASHNGGATNVSGMKLRYVMQVIDATGAEVLRMVKTVDTGSSNLGVSFEGRLPAKEYKALFWADFSADDADNYYDTSSGLQKIKMVAKPYSISNDARDAFYKTIDLDLTTGSILNEDVTLKRPFGKVRLISLDNPDGTRAMGNAKLQYTSPNKFNSGFNVLDGETNESNLSVSTEFSAPVTREIVKKIGGENLVTTGTGEADILAFDYILPTQGSGITATHVVDFDITIFDNANPTPNQLGIKRELSNIPIEPNKLTTIIGNFYTKEFKYLVIVDDEFDDENFEPVDPSLLIKNITINKTYTTLEDALKDNDIASGNEIIIPAGEFSLGDGVTIPEGVIVTGADKSLTTLTANTTNTGMVAVKLLGTLSNVSVVYNPDRRPGVAWNNENPTGIQLFGTATLKNSSITGFRNGVYVNNTSGYTIEGNTITKNRTGIQLANGTDGEITNNTITDNETIGLLLMHLTDNTIKNVPIIKDNAFEGNWSSDLENRWPTSYRLVLDGNDGNTFSGGTRTVVKADDSSEGPSGSDFTKSDVTFIANIVFKSLDNIEVADAEFIGLFAVNNKPYLTLNTALAAAATGDEILFPKGTLDMTSTTVINKAVTLKGASNLASKITTSGTAPVFNLAAGVTIDGLAFEKVDDTDQSIVQAFAAGITIKKSTFDGPSKPLSATTKNIRAIEGSGSAANLTIEGNTFTYVRQPAYLQGTASGGIIANNMCINTRGWVITSGTNFILTDNDFSNIPLIYNFTNISIIVNSPAEINNYPDMVAISAANNNCKVKNDAL